MLKALLINPLLVIVSAAAGLAGCSALGLNAHLHEMSLAAAVCLIAGEAAAIPLLLSRGASQLVMSQAALIGTAVHLFVALGAGGAVMLLMKPGQPFTYWLLTFYWLTLAGVSINGVRALKAAPVQPVAAKPLAAE